MGLFAIPIKTLSTFRFNAPQHIHPGTHDRTSTVRRHHQRPGRGLPFRKLLLGLMM
jgi:hypothetical protein